MLSDTFQSAGYFREKALIGLDRLSGDHLSTAVLKTTSHKLKPPKEKYMQYLLAASYGHCKKTQKNGKPICEYIVRELQKRSHSYNWIIVLKSMVVFHRLMSDASDEMVRTICMYQNVFQFNNIKELRTSAEGARQSLFIQQYMVYLQNRCAMQIALGDCRRIETAEFMDYLTSFNVNTLHPVFSTLLCALRDVGRIKYGDVVVTNFCTYEAYQHIVRDGKTLFQLLSNRVVFVLNGFEGFSLPQKKLWLSQVLLYDEASRALKVLFDDMLSSSHTFVESIPRLKPLPDNLLAHLKDNVERDDMDQDDAHAEKCTLESLGIKSEDPRKNTSESLPVTDSVVKPSPAKPTVAEVVSEKAPPPPKPEPKPQPKPSFTMDDLFEPQPVNAASQQSQLAQQTAAFAQFHDPVNEDDKNATTNMWNSPSPTNWQSNQARGATQGWNTGTPQQWNQDVEQLWSTGAPQQQTLQQSQQQQQQQQWGQPPQQQQQWNQSAPQPPQQQQWNAGSTQQWNAGSAQQWNAGTPASGGSGQGYQSLDGPNFNQPSQPQNMQSNTNPYPPTQSARTNKDPFKDLFADSRQQYGS